MIVRTLFPLLSTWVVVGYIHLLHTLRIYDLLASKYTVVLLGLLIIPLEFFLSVFFSAGRLGNIKDLFSRRLGWTLSFFCRLLFWSALFSFWVIFIPDQAQEAQWLKWFGPYFFLQFFVVFQAQGWITLVALALWVLLYYFLTVKRRRARLFTSAFIPMLFSFMLFIHLYFYGGRGGLYSAGDLVDQAGVALFSLAPGETDINPHPRGIYFDAGANALFAMFGCTFCGDTDRYPTIIRADLLTGETRRFMSGNIRRIAISDRSETLFVIPWYQKNIYELSKADLSILREHPCQSEDYLDYWEPMDVVKDLSTNVLYIGNCTEQALMAYDLATDRITKILNLCREGHVRFGGPLWHLAQSPTTRKLYFISGPGSSLLFEVDPDSLSILKKRNLRDFIGTAMVIDDTNRVLYYQSGLLDSIYAIDMDTFEIERTYSGEAHARRIRLDRKRNRLYVLGYFSGTVFALDLASNKRMWTRHVGGSPHGMALAEDVLWINSMAGVFKLDLEAISGSEGK
jgi:hypothetical protein